MISATNFPNFSCLQPCHDLIKVLPPTCLQPVYCKKMTSRLGELTKQEKIKRLIEEDPYVGEKDLDNDAVTMVLGCDCKGYVHGMGQGISKTEIRASAASREIAHREKQKNDALLNHRKNLEQTVASLQAARCNTPRSSQSSSEFHTPSPSQISAYVLEGLHGLEVLDLSGKCIFTARSFRIFEIVTIAGIIPETNADATIPTRVTQLTEDTDS